MASVASSSSATIGTVADLGYPGDPAIFADACIIVTRGAESTSVAALLAGDASLIPTIVAPIEAAGFTTVVPSETNAFYTRGDETWVVSSEASGTPLPDGLDSALPQPFVSVFHTTGT